MSRECSKPPHTRGKQNFLPPWTRKSDSNFKDSLKYELWTIVPGMAKNPDFCRFCQSTLARGQAFLQKKKDEEIIFKTHDYIILAIKIFSKASGSQNLEMFDSNIQKFAIPKASNGT